RRDCPVDASVAVAPARLGLGHQSGERSRERVELVGGELGAIGQMRPLLGEEALEAQHQRVLALPLDRRDVAAGVDLGYRVLERAAARRARGQDDVPVLTLVQVALAGE